MLHHESIRPPHDDYTPDEWNLIEKTFHSEFVAQTESLFALGNGYLGMRGVPEEGDPSVQNGTFINGFYEEWPIVYSETAYGFARTGQTMLNVADSKIIRLFVDDEPFSVASTNIRHYDRRLNLKAGTLDRELHWETPSGKLVRIRTRRLVSFRHRHVAAISYEVTLLNQEAPVVISSEMLCHTPEVRKTDDDPRRAKMFTGDVLRHRAGYMRDRRVVLAHGTERSHMVVACGIDHELETECQYSSKSSH
jgi:alpha,alpha-trehalose phosphorylase